MVFIIYLGCLTYKNSSKTPTNNRSLYKIPEYLYNNGTIGDAFNPILTFFMVILLLKQMKDTREQHERLTQDTKKQHEQLIREAKEQHQQLMEEQEKLREEQLEHSKEALKREREHHREMVDINIAESLIKRFEARINSLEKTVDRIENTFSLSNERVFRFRGEYFFSVMAEHWDEIFTNIQPFIQENTQPEPNRLDLSSQYHSVMELLNFQKSIELISSYAVKLGNKRAKREIAFMLEISFGQALNLRLGSGEYLLKCEVTRSLLDRCV